jgi:hypothetical protein
MTATQVNLADPTTPANQVAVNNLGQIAVSNFPPVQSVIGTVAVSAFPINQQVYGTIDVTDRATRQVGLVGLASGGNAATVTVAGALKVDGSAVTQPVSGTVTANAGTGTFTVGQATGTNLHTVVDSGTITANAGTGSFTVAQATGSNLHAILDSGSTTVVTQTTASSLNATVQGTSASGASNTGNPVKIGGVFNTTQPTVTTGQTVDAQMTARGSQIVATGVDVFNATINAPLPAGSNTIGAVTQASSPWTQNLTQVNSATLSNTNPVPSQDIEQAGYVSASSPPSQTNAGSDTPYAFSSQVSRIILMNNTSANVYFAFDSTASAGSLVLMPGSLLVYPKKCTVLHLYTASAVNINGTSAGNVVVLGAL